MSSFCSNTNMNLNNLESEMFNTHQDMIVCKISIDSINKIIRDSDFDEKALIRINIYMYMLQQGEEFLKQKLKDDLSEFDKLMNDLSYEELKEHVGNCIFFLNEQCTPDAVVDWREIPRPTPLYWIWILMKKSREGYGINEFINGDCPDEFFVHPIRGHPQIELYDNMLNPEKAIEAIGFIFNDLNEDWHKRDFRTVEEIEEDTKQEIEFMHGSEDDESYKDSEMRYNRMKARMNERSEDDVKQREYSRLAYNKYKHFSINIKGSIHILKRIFKDENSSKYASGVILQEMTEEKSNYYGSMFKKYTDEEHGWYCGYNYNDDDSIEGPDDDDEDDNDDDDHDDEEDDDDDDDHDDDYDDEDDDDEYDIYYENMLNLVMGGGNATKNDTDDNNDTKVEVIESTTPGGISFIEMTYERPKDEK